MYIEGNTMVAMCISSFNTRIWENKGVQITGLRMEQWEAFGSGTGWTET